jgi:predicted transcriptional regulator
MARKKSATLTEAELRLMRVLWQRGEATVADVTAAVRSPAPLAYSTVLTMLRILEHKGYLTHTQQGRAFRYRPIVDQTTARRRAVRHLVSRFFDGSARLLVLNVIEQEKIDVSELRRLRKLVERSGKSR